MRKSKLLPLILILFSCSKDLKQDKEELISKTFYETSDFTGKRMLKDSIENLKLIVNSCKKNLRDTVNGIEYELYTQTIDDCSNERVVIMNTFGKLEAVAYYEYVYCRKRKDTSLFFNSSKDQFINKLKQMTNSTYVKNKAFFLNYFFQNVLGAKKITKDFYWQINPKNPQDSLVIFNYLNNLDRNNYTLVDGLGAFWSFSVKEDSVDIQLLNTKMCRCYAL